MGKLMQENANTILWKACEPFRGKVDPTIYRDYVLAIFFLKYVSDNSNSMVLENDELSDFNHIYLERHSHNYGEIINNTFKRLELLNETKLEGVFDYLDYNLSNNEMLKDMVEEINLLNLSNSNLINRDIPVNSLYYLIEAIEYEVGKRDGSNFLPNEIAELMVELLSPKQGNSIYDPDSGIGNLLTSAFHKANGANLFGQVGDKSLFMISKINMILNGILDSNLNLENAIENPILSGVNKLKEFDIVLSNPSDISKLWTALSKANKANQLEEPYNRFTLGIPPINRSEFVYILHMINSMNENGTMAVVAIPSLLFRGGIEENIRTNIIKENLLEGIIILPERLLPGTGLSLSILLFRNNRKKNDIIMIDASSKDYLIRDKSKYKISKDINDKIIYAYKEYKEIKNFSKVVKLSEIIENDYNLFVPRYISIVNPEEERNSEEIYNRILKIQAQIAEVENDIKNTINKM